jgi:hypothetical protein
MKSISVYAYLYERYPSSAPYKLWNRLTLYRALVDLNTSLWMNKL